MELELPPRTPFNIDHTLTCGQAFRWTKVGATWMGVLDETAIQISQRGPRLFVHTIPEDVEDTVVTTYFRLEDDLPYITTTIQRDATVGGALRRLQGLRLVRQDPWECLISFICATFANIPRIRSMIQRLCQRFGRKIPLEDGPIYGFPRKEALASASIQALLNCKLGYRARYVKQTAQRLVHSDDSLEALRTATYTEARDALLCLPGVGEKVADCVLLFALEKLDAFPVDIRIRRILQTHYRGHFKVPKLEQRCLTPRLYRMFNEFGRQYFGRYAGYAQEYLYADSSLQRSRHHADGQRPPHILTTRGAPATRKGPRHTEGEWDKSLY